MTEDDTFNALRRIPLQQALKIYHEWAGAITPAEIDEKLVSSGWTIKDLRKEYIKTII